MKLFLGLAAAACLFASSAAARDGDPFTLEITNTTTAQVTGVYVLQTNNAWSANALRNRVPTPGSVIIRFAPTDPRCEVKLRITFSDGDVYEEMVDLCSNDGILLENTGISPY